MDLTAAFQQFVAAECEPRTVIEFSVRVSKTKELSTGRYFSPRMSNGFKARVVVTCGKDPHTNIKTMLHEISHHLDWVARTAKGQIFNKSLGHPPSFWRIFWRMMMKYEVKLPGLIEAQFNYMARSNGLYLDIAREMNVPGADRLWEEIQTKQATEEMYRRLQYVRSMKTYRESQNKRAIDFLFEGVG